MTNTAEKLVSKFYKEFGWNTDSEITEDAKKFEDLREYAVDYVSKCRMRVMDYIPASGENIIDMASGPVQYPEYLEYSKNFKKRFCVDYSEMALSAAEKKLGDHGEYLCGNFLGMELPENHFDCAISIHTIYHIDENEQEDAIRKLINITKPGKPVIVVYSSPNPLINYLLLPYRFLRSFYSKLISKQSSELELYVHRHPVSWWYRFSDCADVKIVPWRSFASEHQKNLIPNNKLGGWMFDKLFYLENNYPKLFVKWFQYPMIVITKNES